MIRSIYFFVSLAIALPIWAIIYALVSAGCLTPVAPFDWQAWVSLVVVFPIAEEYIFRGLLMGLFSKYFYPGSFLQVTRSNFFASCIFSAVHVLSQSWATGFAVFLPSLYLGWIREKTNSVLLCAATHILWNFGFFLAATLAYR